MTTKYTYCGICLAACGMKVEVENNNIRSPKGTYVEMPIYN